MLILQETSTIFGIPIFTWRYISFKEKLETVLNLAPPKDVITHECITMMKGKDTISFEPITYVSGTFVGCQKNWEILTKEAYAIYMVFS